MHYWALPGPSVGAFSAPLCPLSGMKGKGRDKEDMIQYNMIMFNVCSNTDE